MENLNLGALREKAGYKTQQDLANAINVKRSRISMWEIGKSAPRGSVIIELANALNVDVETVYKCFYRE